MKNLVLFLGLFLVSCKTYYQNYNSIDYTYQKSSPSRHTTFSFEENQKPYETKLSLFEQALYNSWDSLDVETQNFFNGALIKKPKKIK